MGQQAQRPGKVRAFPRHGRDWTGPYRRVVEACVNLAWQAAIFDGEIIVQEIKHSRPTREKIENGQQCSM